ncbi:PREDICTED: uncharacterized protein LOC108556631 [Nicrophorus vespilloides]|uniref:Uncharacterized protein LOC108556631 n=1 Tax=Nicrophorus vespilloides TaxID=110193 RepID=A0ABM1M154_NICVS|nr:PREDICTED: uncharacterized protein LOC108556631 [Nicrophorus vespilloides]
MIGGNNPGIECCCFSCCTCINIGFLKTENGLLKIAEIILGSFCQFMAVNFGLSYVATMGVAYQGFVTTAVWCVMTTFLLSVCYLVSYKSASLIRQSLFELVFNTVAAFNYISASSYLGFVVKTLLYPQYIITPHFEVYPAMTTAYMIGTLVGIVHAYDAYKSYKYYKGYR